MDQPTQNLVPRPDTQEQVTHPDADEPRARSLGELNATQSLTKSLPPEVLAHIFHHSIQLGPPRMRPQFIIGAVCSHWRTVLWNTPSLWIKYSKEAWRDPRKNPHILLQTYFNNSGVLPISIHIGFRYDNIVSSRGPVDTHPRRKERNKEADLLEPTRTTMFSPGNAKRIHALRLDHLSPSWLLLARQNCTRLHTLEITWRGMYGFGAVAAREISGIWPRMKELLPWTSITVLKIGQLPLNICCGLLAGCPNLIDFSSGCHRPQHEQPSEKGNVMEHLQRLALRPSDTSYYSQFQSFQFPVLQHFSGSVLGLPKLPFDKFLCTIPLTITTLELNISAARGDKGIPDWLSSLFSRIPQLTQLSLTIFPAIPLSGMLLALHNSALLPSLRVLQFSCAREEGTAVGFLQFMEQKKQAGVEEFRFDSVGVHVYWPEDIQEGLRGLVRQGFNIEISEDGVMVPWLSGT